MYKFKALVGLLSSSLLISFSAEATHNGKPIRICSEAGFIPFEMKKTDGTWKGFDIELAQKFGKYIHRSAELVDIKFDGLIPALISGKNCDIVASAMGTNEEREKMVLFSVPTYKSAYAAIIRKKDVNRFKDFSDLNDRSTKIASQAGTEADLYIQKEFKKSTKVQFDNNSDPINAVLTSKADVYIDDSLYLSIAGVRHSSKLLLLPLNVLPNNKFGSMAFAFRKTDVTLRDSFNAFYKQMEKSGELKKLQIYYFKDMPWMAEFPN